MNKFASVYLRHFFLTKTDQIFHLIKANLKLIFASFFLCLLIFFGIQWYHKDKIKAVFVFAPFQEAANDIYVIGKTLSEVNNFKNSIEGKRGLLDLQMISKLPLDEDHTYKRVKIKIEAIAEEGFDFRLLDQKMTHWLDSVNSSDERHYRGREVNQQRLRILSNCISQKKHIPESLLKDIAFYLDYDQINQNDSVKILLSASRFQAELDDSYRVNYLTKFQETQKAHKMEFQMQFLYSLIPLLFCLGWLVNQFEKQSRTSV